MADTKAITDLLVAARTATVNIKPNAIRLRKEKQIYVAESLEKLQDAIASLGKASTALLDLVRLAISPSVFTNRGDPAVADYATADFTKDGAFHDLDLSAIVPFGAKAVLLSVTASTTAAGKTLSFQRNGNTGGFALSPLTTQVAGQTVSSTLMVVVDGNRICEYKADVATWSVLNVTVIGWIT